MAGVVSGGLRPPDSPKCRSCAAAARVASPPPPPPDALNFCCQPDSPEFRITGLIQARRVLEIGTSNGYSTLWLADAVQRLGGRVTTIEVLPDKAHMARHNFARAELASWIQLHLGDAGDVLREQEPASFDLVFLDSDRAQYVSWWPDLQRVLTPGGLMVVDMCP